MEHEFYFSIYWECHHPNWRTHIFQRGRSTTKQIRLPVISLPLLGTHDLGPEGTVPFWVSPPRRSPRLSPASLLRWSLPTRPLGERLMWACWGWWWESSCMARPCPAPWDVTMGWPWDWNHYRPLMFLLEDGLFCCFFNAVIRDCCIPLFQFGGTLIFACHRRVMFHPFGLWWMSWHGTIFHGILADIVKESVCLHQHDAFASIILNDLGFVCGYPVACSVLLGSWCFMFVTKVWKKCWEQSPLRCLDGTNLCRMRPWAGCNEVSWGVPRQEVKSTNLFIPNMMLSLPFYLGWWLSQLCV